MTIEATKTQAYLDDRAHVFHSWSAQGTLNPVEITGGEGSYFWDSTGKKYLDFSSQLVNLNIGHQHPKLIAAIQEQAGKLCTVAPAFANDARSEAARLITELAPGDLNMVFFTNGGAEAAENAVRMSKLHTGRHKILTMYRSYHGSTAGAIANTIVNARKDSPIKNTEQLKQVLSRFLPAHKSHKILAQIYQAIRIEVNQEMEVLKEFLVQALDVLKPEGRLSVISYHSLEDRLVKRFMKNGLFEGEPERDFFGNYSVPFKSIGKLIVPDNKEIKINNRARSAKLRIAEKK